MQNQENKPSENKVPSKHTHHLRYTDFEFVKILGMGAYGKVELVQRKGIKYALKIIEKRILAKEGKQYQAFIQRELLRRMKHPGVVALKTCFQDRQNLYFCLEYCEGGDFISFMNNNENKMTEELRVFYLAQIVSIVEYFQTIKIVHRDIKPQNILLSEKGHLKLIDFATAEVTQCNLIDEKFKEQLHLTKSAIEEKEAMEANQLRLSINTMKLREQQQSAKCQVKSSSSEQTQEQTSGSSSPTSIKKRKATFVGTCYYVSPQLLEEEACFPATDLWAFGCIMYQLYYLTPPFDGNSEFEVFQKIKSLQLKFPKNDKITPEAIDLIIKLLQKNPSDRIGCNSRQGLMMSDLKSHPFFSKINFETIFQTNVPVIEEEKSSEKDKERLQKTGDQIMKQYLCLLENNNYILIHGVIQKRTFLNYNLYYLIVFKNLKMLRIKVTEPGKTRETQVDLERLIQQLPAEVIDESSFKLFTKEKTYKLKTHNPNTWTNSINQRFKQLKEKFNKENQVNEQGDIQKQCKSISQMLRSVKVVMVEE